MKRFSFALSMLFVLAGCKGLLGPDHVRRLAVIEFTESDSVVVEVPATVTRGVPFEVAITTYGGGCVRQGDTQAQVSGLTANVEPYQLVVGDEDAICTQELRTFRNVAPLRFDQAGTGRIRFHGHSRIAGETITVERTVMVQ